MTPSTATKPPATKPPAMAPSTGPKTLGPTASKPGDITKPTSTVMDQGSSPPNINEPPLTKTPPINTVNKGGRKHKKRLTKKRNRRYKR
jgi:hypothetical protein